MTGASGKAVEAADTAYFRAQADDLPGRWMTIALQAAHDPALGLDRSVCLRDVVEALRHGSPGSLQWGEQAATFIEREFC